jgi:cytochrome b561
VLLGSFPKQNQPFWVNVHGTVGLLYVAVVLVRIGWRLSQQPPELPPDIGEFSRRTSTPVHLLLYALMLVVPAMGMVAYVWHGRALDYGLFRMDFAIPLTPNIFKPAETMHGWLAYGLLEILNSVSALHLMTQFHLFGTRQAPREPRCVSLYRSSPPKR